MNIAQLYFWFLLAQFFSSNFVWLENNFTMYPSMYSDKKSCNSPKKKEKYVAPWGRPGTAPRTRSKTMKVEKKTKTNYQIREGRDLEDTRLQSVKFWFTDEIDYRRYGADVETIRGWKPVAASLPSAGAAQPVGACLLLSRPACSLPRSPSLCLDVAKANEWVGMTIW